MRSAAIEQALKNQGVEFTYLPRVEREQIDSNKGLRNQARLELPLDDELVKDYVTMRKDGMEPPALVLWRPGKGKYIPADGNHRIAAGDEEDVKEYDAYVLSTTDPMVVDRISWRINNLVNGKQNTRAEILEHAKTFVRKYGQLQKEAAKEWGISFGVLSASLRVDEIRNQLLAAAVPARKIPDDKIRALAPFQDMGEDLLVAAANLTMECGLKAEDIRSMLEKVRRARTSEAKMEALTAFRVSDLVTARKAETKGGKLKVERTPRVQLLALLRQQERFLEKYPDTKGLRPAPTEFKEARAIAERIVNAYNAIFGFGAGTRAV